MKFLSALAAGSQERFRRLLFGVALASASALSAIVGLGFATNALFEQWRAQYGVVDASLGLSVIYLLLSAILYLCHRRADWTSFAKAHSSETLRGDAEASGVRQAMALAMGAEIAQQMTPLQLTMIAAISGFVAGRKL